MEAVLAGALLRVDLGWEHRCLASAVRGGGLGAVRTWVNLQVRSDYARTDPGVHLAEVTAGLPAPVVGMLTAAAVKDFHDVACGSARAIATIGLGWPIAAAGRREAAALRRPSGARCVTPDTERALQGRGCESRPEARACGDLEACEASPPKRCASRRSTGRSRFPAFGPGKHWA